MAAKPMQMGDVPTGMRGGFERYMKKVTAKYNRRQARLYVKQCLATSDVTGSSAMIPEPKDKQYWGWSW